MMQYIASCSFGKDSLAAIIECERRGLHIDKALYVRIMFDDETSAELPEHEEFIHNKAIPLLKSLYGIETEVLQADYSYCDCFYRKYKHSKKYALGTIWGFPCLVTPWCNTYLKVNLLEKWQKTAGEHKQIVGIAADETKRIGHKTNQSKFLPLVEWGITEKQCFDICRYEGLLSPAYSKGRQRLGCWFCHNQRISELRRLRNEYPELWAKMLVLDKVSPVKFNTKKKTLSDFDRRFAEEERQLSFEFKEMRMADD